MAKDAGIPEDESLATDLENFVDDYLYRSKDLLLDLLVKWLDPGPKLRLEKRLSPILDRSAAEIVGELERALGPQAGTRND